MQACLNPAEQRDNQPATPVLTMVLILILLLFCETALLCQVKVQRIKTELEKVKSTDDATRFITTHQHMFCELKTIDPRKDSTSLSQQIFRHKIGDIVSETSRETGITHMFKILAFDEIESFRVSYIFLDNERMGMQKVDSLRTLILARLREGDHFEALALKYSMDSNGKKGGDLGWFDSGMMVKEFENAVREHQVGDIFKVDINSEQWYYIVKKTFAPKMIQEATVLYIEITN
jgi:hypothetical protein